MWAKMKGDQLGPELASATAALKANGTAALSVYPSASMWAKMKGDQLGPELASATAALKVNGSEQETALT